MRESAAMPRDRNRGKTGFTLIEILVVCAIIGILAVIMLSKVQRALWKAREGATYQGLNALRLSVDMYRAVNEGAFPTWILYGASEAQWIDPMDPPASFNYGNVRPEYRQYMDETPKCMAADNGIEKFTFPPQYYTNAIWTAFVTGFPPAGNYRGWYYERPTGWLCINNNSLSTEGRQYFTY